MKNLFAKHLNQFNSPLITLNFQGNILESNLLAKTWFKKANINIENQETLDFLFSTPKAYNNLLLECTNLGFSVILGVSRKINTTKNISAQSYDLFAFKTDSTIQLFICQNTKEQTLEQSELITSQKLLDKALNLFSDNQNFYGNIYQLFILISKYLPTTHIQLFEYDLADATFKATQSWSKPTAKHKKIAPNKLEFSYILPTLKNYLLSQDYFFSKNPTSSDNKIFNRFIQLNNIQSILALPLKTQGDLNKIIVFENKEKDMKWSTLQIDTISKISQLISLVNHNNSTKIINSETNILKTIISNSKAITALVEQGSNKIIFANKLFMDTTNFEAMDLHCWNKIVHSEAQSCETCVLNDKKFSGSFSKDVYLPDLKAWLKIEHKVLNWVNNKRLILFWAENISPMKINEHTIQKELKTDPITGELNIEAGLGLLQQVLKSTETKPQTKIILPKMSSVGTSVIVVSLDNYDTIQEGLGSEEAVLALKKFAITIKNDLGLKELARINNNSFFAIIDDKDSNSNLYFNIQKYFNKINSNTNDISSYITESSFGIANSLQLGTQEAGDLVATATKNMLLFRRNKLNSLNNFLL